jgi:hypothetical protein
MDYINDTVWFCKKSTSLNALRKGACRQRVIERCPCLSIATERLDRRMNSLIEAYQGMFAGTRIATVGFAMETAGLGCPKLLGLDVVERPARGMVPNPGQALADCNRGTWSSRRRGPGGDFDHAQSVNFQPNPTLRGGHSCSEPRHCGFRSGASRPSLPFLMNNARSKSNRSSRGFQDPAKVLCILSPALCLATPQPHSRNDFPYTNFDMRRCAPLPRDGALEIRRWSGIV